MNIIGATLAFREGELIRYCLDDLIKYSNQVVVVLDNYDDRTEKIVLEYKEKYNIIVAYSTIERSSEINEVRVGGMKSRLNAKQGRIRQQVLNEVKKLHEQKPVDVLIWLDADECLTDYFSKELEIFLKSDKRVLAIRPVTIYDSFKLARSRTLIPHGKVFKYIPEISAIGYRGRGIYLPFTGDNVMRSLYTMIHLPLLTKENREFRKHYVGDRSDKSNNYFLFDLGEDARRLTPMQINKLLLKPMCTVKKYEQTKNTIKKLSN